MIPSIDLRDYALVYHQRLPKKIWKYLNTRGIPDALIHKHLLGWNGQRITIPIPNRDGRLTLFRLAKDPEDRSDSPKMLSTRGAHAELYGWERVLAEPDQIIICEGEFDRLVLEGQGFAGVTSTGGTMTFRPEWADALKDIPQVFICFDNDAAGRLGVQRVSRHISQARVVRLPDEVGDGGDVTDFFVRLGRTREDFLALLKSAQLAPQDTKLELKGTKQDFERRAAKNRVEQIKNAVRIENLMARHVTLRKSGKTLTGRCPFHQERIPSFVVYPETQSYYCFGCRAHGDVAAFLMRIERLTFPETLAALRKLAKQHERRDQASN